MRGVKDNQSVQDARPLAPAQFVGPVWTTTSYAIPIWTTIIPLTSLASFSVGDLVAIMTCGDGGTLFRAYITEVGTFSFATGGAITTESGLDLETENGLILETEGLVSGIVINVPLPSPVSLGAQVWNYGPITGGPADMRYAIPLGFTIVPNLSPAVTS